MNVDLHTHLGLKYSPLKIKFGVANLELSFTNILKSYILATLIIAVATIPLSLTSSVQLLFDHSNEVMAQYSNISQENHQGTSRPSD